MELPFQMNRNEIKLWKCHSSLNAQICASPVNLKKEMDSIDYIIIVYPSSAMK